MRRAHSALFFLALLLGSCQGPRVTVLVNELKPGMLRGRTVGIGGMVATFAAWPGKSIDPAILTAAEQALQRSLKSSRVYVMPADWIVHSSAPCKYDGNMTSSAALDATVTRFSKAHAKLADYFFMIFLRTDAIDHINKSGKDTDYNYVVGRASSSYSRGGSYGNGSWGSRDSWRGHTQHTLKADYLLFDTRTNQIVWRAKTVFCDDDMSINETSIGFRTPTKWAQWLPATPTAQLWMPMNAFTARTLRKSGASSHQARMIGGWFLN